MNENDFSWAESLIKHDCKIHKDEKPHERQAVRWANVYVRKYKPLNGETDPFEGLHKGCDTPYKKCFYCGMVTRCPIFMVRKTISMAVQFAFLQNKYFQTEKGGVEHDDTGDTDPHDGDHRRIADP